MFETLRSPFLALALGAVLAPAAGADSFGIAFGKKTRHGSIAIGYSTGAFWAPSHRMHCAPPVWVPAHFETRCEQVWVAGCYETVWVEPVFELRYDACGRAYKICVAGGHTTVVQKPGHYVTRQVQVWVAGHWQDG